MNWLKYLLSICVLFIFMLGDIHLDHDADDHHHHEIHKNIELPKKRKRGT